MYVCDSRCGMGGGGGGVSETAVPDSRAGAGAEQDDGFLGLCQVVRGRRWEGQLGQREARTGIFPWEKWRKMGIFWYVMCLGKNRRSNRSEIEFKAYLAAHG